MALADKADWGPIVEGIPPPAPAPTSIWHAPTAGTPGDPGYAPNYIDLYHASPAYQAWLASATGRLGTYSAQRAAAMRELIRQYGYIPPGFIDAYGDVRPEDIAAAQSNQFSTEAGIQQNYNIGVEQMRRALAARGMLQSGELGIGQSAQETARGQAESNAFNSLMGAVQQSLGEYTTGTQGVLAEETPLLAQTLPDIVAANPARAGTAGTAGSAGWWETPPANPPPAPPYTYTPPPIASIPLTQRTGVLRSRYLEG
jgi:hypothetical protein